MSLSKRPWLGSQKFSQDELNVTTFLGGKLAEQLLASESSGTEDFEEDFKNG